MKRGLLLLLLAGLAALGTPRPAVADEPAWQVIKIGNRDYLTLDNIAQFYQLQGNPRVVDRRVTLEAGRTRLEMGTNPREIFINGVKQWLLFPALVSNDQVFISRFDLAKTIEPCLRPSMVANLSAFDTVVIDAGHGGVDRGASSRLGNEKDYTLEVCQSLQKSLEAKGLKVILTRDDDRYLTLEGRADLANQVNNAVFVSLHFNSAGDGGHANGFEVYALTPQGAASTADSFVALEQFEGTPGNEFDNASLALATCVQHSLLGHIPQNDRGVRRARFAVLRLTRAPAILVEGGFLTNDQDSRSINDPQWRERLAESIAQGVRSFQDVAVRRQPPKLLVDYRNEQLPLLGTIVNPATLVAARSTTPTALVPVSNPGGTPVLVPADNPGNPGQPPVVPPPAAMPTPKQAGGFPSVN